ncbi:MAG: N-acetylmuramoyl-L-alanine amidase CwlH precursor [Firmicutes bacterium ADurb.Bin193]|nr:MAG: N-acetylmuramoyl-L-alanine amidase CwlH precursor [Firmicutes bacterium ADurb.Bin193]
MTINKKQIAYNRSKRTGPIRYIVIHDTGNAGKGANANAHFNYFNGGDRQSSADFFVDNTQVMQVNDYNTYYTWHCGDGAGKYGISNANSIGIEICVNSDGNYDTAFQNAVALTKQLMSELNIPIERVVRHYDASRKNCPASMSNNNWLLWNTFKAQLVVNTEPTSVNDIVWELAHRGIISDSGLWLEKLKKDSNAYWLARKTVKYLQSKGV